MNQNRVWPGVPNRYRIRSSAMVIRPKSMATVVVVLPGTLRGSSMPTPAEVIIASVVSGVISETEPTSVVLPTPNPPAMTIFAEVIRRTAAPRRGQSLRSPLSTLSSSSIRSVVPSAGAAVYRDQAVGRHVGDQHPGHPQRQPHVRGDLRERLRPALTQRGDAVLVAPGEAGTPADLRSGVVDQDRLEGDVQPWARYGHG